MAGLDPAVLARFDKDQAIGRIRTDIRTDFISAPQYKLIFDVIADDLWDDAIGQLRAGGYNPSPLITAEVPKPSRMTRPGSIMSPLDRLVYQALVDHMAPIVDTQLDGERVFSYRLMDPDPSFQMFHERSESYGVFKDKVTNLSISGQFTHSISTDISSYFMHLNHHVLENLLTEAGISEGVVRLLVKSMLETWSGRFTYGIPQGVFASDLLGNFYLSTLDTFLASQDVLSLRYVDDIVMFFPARRDAEASFAPMCKFLRGIGLDLNESKTDVTEVEKLVYEQTALDRLNWVCHLTT